MRHDPKRGSEVPAAAREVRQPSGEGRPIPRRHGLTRGALIGTIMLSVLLACGLLAHDFAAWRRAESEVLPHYAEHVHRATEAYFDRYEKLFQALAEADCVRLRHGESCSAFFARVKGHFPQVMNFAAVGADGRFFATSHPFGPAGPPDA
jgi:hypothetical protein